MKTSPLLVAQTLALLALLSIGLSIVLDRYRKELVGRALVSVIVICGVALLIRLPFQGRELQGRSLIFCRYPRIAVFHGVHFERDF